jgi:hypothetical protein
VLVIRDTRFGIDRTVPATRDTRVRLAVLVYCQARATPNDRLRPNAATTVEYRVGQYLEQENMAFAANADANASASADKDEEVDEAYYDVLHKDDCWIQDEMKDPVAFIYATDEDTMYYNQAMRAPTNKKLWRR